MTFEEIEKENKMTAGKLIEGMRQLLKQFNEDNEVGIERIDVECEKEEKRTLDGKRGVEYTFHMTFSE